MKSYMIHVRGKAFGADAEGRAFGTRLSVTHGQGVCRAAVACSRPCLGEFAPAWRQDCGTPNLLPDHVPFR